MVFEANTRNKTELTPCERVWKSVSFVAYYFGRSHLGILKDGLINIRGGHMNKYQKILKFEYSEQILRTIWNSYSHGTYFFPAYFFGPKVAFNG